MTNPEQPVVCGSGDAGSGKSKHMPWRLHFLRCELARFEREAAFNRAHYGEAEAHCWDVLAADARATIAKTTLRICPTCDLPPIGDCAFANCKREFAALAKASAKPEPAGRQLFP